MDWLMGLEDHLTRHESPYGDWLVAEEPVVSEFLDAIYFEYMRIYPTDPSTSQNPKIEKSSSKEHLPRAGTIDCADQNVPHPQTDNSLSGSPTRTNTISEPTRGRVNQAMHKTDLLDNVEIEPLFECTFCRARVVPKSWKRHEESQHFPQREWICMPFESSSIDGSACVFCHQPCHDQSHNEICPNRVTDCLKRSYEGRRFERGDKLRQHIKEYHQSASSFEVLENWSFDTHFAKVFWDCGFCDATAMTWTQRAKHIPEHFREGKDMSMWRSTVEVVGHAPSGIS
jgi:hypothetical protein